LAVVEKVRRSARHFNWRSIRDHYNSLTYHYILDSLDGTLTKRERSILLWDVIKDRLDAAICELKGHDYDTNGHDYPEDGGEGFTCRRCGHSFVAWH
jgi:hypothetical protein